MQNGMLMKKKEHRLTTSLSKREENFYFYNMDKELKKKLINWAMLLGILLIMVFGFKLLQTRLAERKAAQETEEMK